jgi:hypothetical protein
VGGAVRIRGACLDVEKSQPPYFCCGYLVALLHHVDHLLLLGQAIGTSRTFVTRLFVNTFTGG